MSGFIHERTPKQIEVDAAVLARVKAGIAFLEEKIGPDWVEDFGRLEGFDIESGYSCVLGKIEGSYGDGLERLEICEMDSNDFSPSIALGFHGRYVNDDPQLDEPNEADWEALQRIWKQELRALGVPE